MKAAVLLVASLLVACGAGHEAPEPKWKLHTRVEFVGSDFKTPREAIATDGFYLAFPFIGGDLYGAPTTGDYVQVNVDDDYSFVLDLSTSARFAARATKPAAIGEGRVHGQPTNLRLARVATFTMDSKTNQRAGFTGWWDVDTERNLVLAFFDRPGRIVGSMSEQGHEYRFDISVERAGYVWLRRQEAAENITELTVSEWPRALVLRVAPLTY